MILNLFGMDMDVERRDGEMIEVLECWSVGVLECWSVGVLKCWSVGVLEC